MSDTVFSMPTLQHPLFVGTSNMSAFVGRAACPSSRITNPARLAGILMVP
jgi:hypothetical protein